MPRWLRIVLWLGGMVVLLLGALLSVRALAQHRNATMLALSGQQAIHESLYVRAGGIDQWVQIRGRDRRNPILLCINGGPGASWVPLTTWFLPWESEFTVVQWDQRGEGRTLERSGPEIRDSMSVDRMTHDGIEVTTFLLHHLDQKKLYVLGHSWGSILGIHMIHERPDLFAGYAGTGQASDLKASLVASYRDALARARRSGDGRTARELREVGPPPYGPHLKPIARFFDAIGRYASPSDQAILRELGPEVLTAPNYSLRDVCYRYLGFARVPTPKIYDEMLSTDLNLYATDFAVPIVFIQGSEDNITVAAETRKYFDRIRAPRKEFIEVQGAGHFAVWSRPDRVLEALRRLR